MEQRWTRRFTTGDPNDRDLLGGKGAGLTAMTQLGLPVPPGFVITTDACRAYLANDGEEPAGLWQEVEQELQAIESETGKRIGDPACPLLLSVRSGAKISMPGMMDTILNIGLNDETAAGLAKLANERFALDSYRRLIQMFSRVALGVDTDDFEDALADVRARAGAPDDASLTPDALREVIARYRAILAEHGVTFPDDPHNQIRLAALAVFRSWNTPRAIAYREANQIPDDIGTAAVVQTMVFGNLGDDSGTGVAFTRDPNTGEDGLFGEFLPNAQGEDVVAGIRTPIPIQTMAEHAAWRPAHRQLTHLAEQLETHERDMQDIEFTVEQGQLWLLQTRTGKRTAQAAVTSAVALSREGLIDKQTAVQRVTPENIEQLLHPRLDERSDLRVIATGLPASPGAAIGQVVLDPDEARQRGANGEAVILVRNETAADDFPGMQKAQGLLTARGGMTSHAAVVARGMGKPAVTGCSDLEIDQDAGVIRVGDLTLHANDEITIDGGTGRVFLGHATLVQPELRGTVKTLLNWADCCRRLGVRANADTPEDAARARALGAEGIGLCRTEHMFFGEDRIDAMREMILAESDAARESALRQLEQFQTADFEGIFRAMDGLPVVIRTLDPPLHEFLPRTPEEIARLAERLKLENEAIEAKIEELREGNPMLGHRGCRLGITFPEVTTMQARAIFRAAHACAAAGIEVKPAIMIPLVSTAEELRRQREVVESVARECCDELSPAIAFKVGTMIELPRAALTAGELAEYADFFSFGTNDLTQTTLGMSRDDAGRFLPDYLEAGIYPADPFQTLDIAGVGRLIRIATTEGRAVKPNLITAICGEHGGDPRSIDFCEDVGMDYVSCSPFRVPVARLAAAHAAIEANA
jgi:pyruvate,orthophosphate dikinase